MTTKLPVLGKAVDDGAEIVINIEELIGSDICIVANKGAGKSGMQRVLLEATHGLIRQVVIDPEGEYHTLRQIGDYLIAGGEEADCPATIANAALLAQMLMENPGISAVVQIDHLKPWEQEQFVGLFLEAIMAAPRAQWAPMLLDIDETHRFAPQDGNVASSAAMRDVIGRGRKRGITPVFATYRVAAIDKNVTAGSPTWFMGRVGQEIDRKAAAMALGFTPSSAEAKDISFLPKRRFWTYGSATTPRPVLFDVADARTTMTKAGQAMAPVPPAPKSLRKLVEALSRAAAPVAAEEVVSAAPGVPQADLDAIRRDARQEGLEEGLVCGDQAGAQRMLFKLRDWTNDQIAGLSDINVGVDDRDLPDERISGGWQGPTSTPVRPPSGGSSVVPPGSSFLERAVQRAETSVKRATAEAVQRVAADVSALGTNAAGLALLEAITQHFPMRVTWSQAAGFAKRKARGGSFNTAKKWLIDNGLVEERGGDVVATPEGLKLRPPPELGTDKVEAWCGRLPTPADVLLRHLVDHPGLTAGELAEATGRAPRGGSWNTAMKNLTANNLVEADDDGRLSPATWLFQ